MDVSIIKIDGESLSIKDSLARNSISAEIARSTAKDNLIDQEISDINVDLSSEISRAVTRENSLESEIETKHSTIRYAVDGFNNVYLNAIGGNDLNDGTITHPYKTLEKCLSKFNEGCSDLRIWIQSAGTYKWEHFSLNNCVSHIIAQVDGVVIEFAAGSTAISIYNSHVNWYSTSGGPLTLRMPGTYGTYTNQVLYFENCATTLKNVVFDSAYRLDTFGGSVDFEDVEIKGQIFFQSTVGICDNITISNNNNSTYAIGVYSGSNIQFYTEINVNEMSVAGVSGNALMRVYYSTVYIAMASHNTGLTKRYYQAFQISNSQVVCTPVRFATYQSLLASNNNSISNGLINGTVTDL